MQTLRHRCRIESKEGRSMVVRLPLDGEDGIPRPLGTYAGSVSISARDKAEHKKLFLESLDKMRRRFGQGVRAIRDSKAGEFTKYHFFMPQPSLA